jgi:hypothetical protein
MKPVLIGTRNPHSSDPRDALAPWPTGATGWRIWRMLNARTGATHQHYMDAFDRMNMADGHLMWRLNGFHAIPDQLAGMTVVCLGDEVRRYFSLPKCLIHPIVGLNGVVFRQIPHPSGLNRWYNDPHNRAVVELMLEELYNR